MKGVDLKQVKLYHILLKKVREEVSKTVVGQEKVVTGFLRGLIANGHVLVEGVPGIAKTLLVRTLAIVTGCDFKRVQFTVDLLPTDIVGLESYVEGKGFITMKGPIFANFILADEINRTPPKTQSALLEAMQEKQVTIAKQTYSLPKPFFVMATQNPLEQEGVYRLPEAQVDRFLFKLLMGYPNMEEEQQILMKNITIKRFEDFQLNAILTPKKIVEMQEFVQKVYLDPEIEKYIVRIIDATRNPAKYKITNAKYVEWGCSPRAGIGLFIGAKTEALLNGKGFVTPQHVKDVAYDVMRHRLILNYEAEAEKITSDVIIKEILARVPVP
ncbi:MAG: MoxR family ATPase [Nanoarchaeota archaeon]|nr:MoxR family ATPase [Nanoarchaeota archaeon]MBU4241891.1 MoxR family ATPase [Nanoarchaeota archaeon]MBU4351643.1 MoxR family ATPase [Nanoarchaeota archaeon]MBU4456859.1 MoxR family ATPase [Nanoarchaeota archaeon]MCG2719739.1 MoxR family ATPase [Nanoarchaeota archaeon]